MEEAEKDKMSSVTSESSAMSSSLEAAEELETLLADLEQKFLADTLALAAIIENQLVVNRFAQTDHRSGGLATPLRDSETSKKSEGIMPAISTASPLTGLLSTLPSNAGQRNMNQNNCHGLPVQSSYNTDVVAAATKVPVPVQEFREVNTVNRLFSHR
jgi:hypothetical protein